MRRSSIVTGSGNALRRLSIPSSSSGIGFLPPVMPTRGQRMSSISGAGGRRLTLTDLETQGPFENLKNIDKPTMKPRFNDDDDAAPTSATRISFIDPGHDGVKYDTQQPVTSSVRGKTDAEQEPVTSLAGVPLHSTQEPTTARPTYTEVRYSPREPMTSALSGYPGAEPRTQETTTSSACVYTGTPPVRRNGPFFLGRLTVNALLVVWRRDATL